MAPLMDSTAVLSPSAESTLADTAAADVTSVNGVSWPPLPKSRTQLPSYLLPKTRLPAPQKTDRIFQCEIPFRPKKFPKIHQALPFPEELLDVIGWIDAYIDRAAALAMMEREQLDEASDHLKGLDAENKLLNERLTSALEQADTWKDKYAEADSKRVAAEVQKKCVEDNLAGANAKIKDLESRLKTAEDEYMTQLKDNDALRNNKRKLEEALQAADKKAFDVLKRLEKEHADHMEDHKELDARDEQLRKKDEMLGTLRKENGALTKRTGALEAELSNLEGRLAKTRCDKEEVEKKLEEARKAKDELTCQLNGQRVANADLGAQLKEKERDVRDLTDQKKGLLDNIAQLHKDVEDAREDLDRERAMTSGHWGKLEAIRVDGGWVHPPNA